MKHPSRQGHRGAGVRAGRGPKQPKDASLKQPKNLRPTAAATTVSCARRWAFPSCLPVLTDRLLEALALAALLFERLAEIAATLGVTGARRIRPCRARHLRADRLGDVEAVKHGVCASIMHNHMLRRVVSGLTCRRWQ